MAKALGYRVTMHRRSITYQVNMHRNGIRILVLFVSFFVFCGSEDLEWYEWALGAQGVKVTESWLQIG